MINQDKIKELIKKYRDLIHETINPDNQDWEDIGFSGPQDGYDSVDDYIENEFGELDEGEQTDLRNYREFIEDLKNLLEDK